MGVMKERFSIVLALLLGILLATALPCYSQGKKADSVLDEKVKVFLEKMRNQWQDWNVPEEDGKILYDIIVQNQYKRALEVGTSTGHSAVWIAWALSKTGGKLITIEIDEDRYRQALANFKEAGLSSFIEARNADAHQLVKELKGPFDFVFSDADKEWYTQYFVDLDPKLVSFWWEHAGKLGCTGCGRCVRYCPVGLDIRAMLRKASAYESEALHAN